MPEVVKRTFSLTEEQARFIDDRVAGGQYASASEVVRESLRGLQEDAAVFDDWVRREIVPVVNRIKAGKEKLYTAAEVRKSLDREYRL